MAVPARLVSHLQSGEVSRVVYGAIIGLAIVVTMQAHPPKPVAALVTLVATAVAVALAELYSEWVGARTRAGLAGGQEPMGVFVEEAVAVAFGVAFPGVYFVATILGWLDYDTAFTLTKWTGLGLISGYAYVAARLAGDRAARAVAEAGIAGLVAGALILLKAWVH